MVNSYLTKTSHNKIKLVVNILAYSDIIRYINGLSRDAQTHAEGCLAVVYSEPWNIWNPGMLETWHIQNFSIFRTLVYSEPWYIKNPGIYRAMAYLEPEPYSEPCYIQDLKHNPNSANICNRLVFENNANSFLHYFQMWKIVNWSRLVTVRPN